MKERLKSTAQVDHLIVVPSIPIPECQEISKVIENGSDIARILKKRLNLRGDPKIFFSDQRDQKAEFILDKKLRIKGVASRFAGKYDATIFVSYALDDPVHVSGVIDQIQTHLSSNGGQLILLEQGGYRLDEWKRDILSSENGWLNSEFFQQNGFLVWSALTPREPTPAQKLAESARSVKKFIMDNILLPGMLKKMEKDYLKGGWRILNRDELDQAVENYRNGELNWRVLGPLISDGLGVSIQPISCECVWTFPLNGDQPKERDHRCPDPYCDGMPKFLPQELKVDPDMLEEQTEELSAYEAQDDTYILLREQSLFDRARCGECSSVVVRSTRFLGFTDKKKSVFLRVEVSCPDCGWLEVKNKKKVPASSVSDLQEFLKKHHIN